MYVIDIFLPNNPLHSRHMSDSLNLESFIYDLNSELNKAAKRFIHVQPWPSQINGNAFVPEKVN